MPSVDRSTIAGGHVPARGCVTIPASPWVSYRGFCSSSHPASALTMAAIGDMQRPRPRWSLEDGGHQYPTDTAVRLKGQENHLPRALLLALAGGRLLNPC